MTDLLECVPNFSDGRDPAVLDAIVAAATAGGVACLGRESDHDHNRSVVTLAGPPDELVAGIVAAAAAAAERIDLRGQSGVHMRMGALDVCPFVPLSGTPMSVAVEAALAAADRIAASGVPVFLYGHAAERPERRVLGAVRNHEFEQLVDLVGADPRWDPDRGPRRLHPSAGATAVGARDILVAYNINLETDDVSIAREIARAVRESSGGLPGVQARGFALARGDCAQVSMNLLDYRRTSVREVFDAVVSRATARGVAVRESELIGLAPEAALDPDTARHVKLPDFDPQARLLEARLRACGLG